MTAMQAAVRLLVVSPIPSHPQDQGNSARIFTLCQALREAGVIVHFLYARMEGLTEAQRIGMQSGWDHFHPIAYAPPDMRPSLPTCYGLDDWYDPAVTRFAAELHRRWHFHAVLVNYVWFSRVLAGFPSSVLKILDTHDVFGARDQRFRDAGIEPEWYYTSPAEEARGLARADIVLAIQAEEAAFFRAAGHDDVRVIGHAPGQRRRAVRPPGGPVRVGYLASGNPLNRRSLADVVHHLPALGVAGLRCLVAGSICDRLEAGIGPFASIGRVGDLDEFYDQVDIVINPMQFGTGLKIKSVEALFQGLPLIATRAAMAGLPTRHEFHDLMDARAVAACLMETRFDARVLGLLADASRASARAYRAEVRAGICALVESMQQHACARAFD
jgi:glycosyltransferase involved in cell wall biosynthesis